MQRLLASILTLTLLLPLLAFYCSLTLARWHIQEEVQAHIRTYGGEEKELQLLKIPKAVEFGANSTFVRMHAGEFRYEGKMYDVVKQEPHEEETWYWVYHDVKETLLMARVDQMLAELFGPQPLQDTGRTSLRLFYPQFVTHDLLTACLLNYMLRDVQEIPASSQATESGFPSFCFVPPPAV